jgi:solute carrier family 35 protein E1
VAFSLSSAPFVETIKSSEPITTVVLAYLLLGERETSKSLACLVPVMVGVALASMGDMAFSLPAFCAVQLCNLGFSGRAVFVKQLKSKFPNAAVSQSMLELFFHVHRLGLGLLVPVVLLAERQALWALTPDVATKLAATMAINGVFYSVYNLFSFFVLARVPTSAHAVLNVFRRVVVILITTVFFQVPMSATNLAGVGLAVGGVLLFKAAKQQQQLAKAAPVAQGSPPPPSPPSAPPPSPALDPATEGLGEEDSVFAVVNEAAVAAVDAVADAAAAVEEAVAPAVEEGAGTAAAEEVASVVNEAPHPAKEAEETPAAA